MKTTVYFILMAAMLLMMPAHSFAQAPPLGTTAGFVLFSTNGAVSNTGISQLTGNIGTNNGSSTGFGNVNGQMHDADGASAQASADLLIAYNALNSAIPTFFVAPLMGNGDTLVAGVYFISSAATLDGNLYLDAEGDANAVFIFQIQGAFATGAGAKVKMINQGEACNVFWKVEGMADLATGTAFRGTIIANNAAVHLGSGDTLEGRAFSTSGAVAVDGVLAYTPIGCGSPHLTGPAAPLMGTAECYGLFSADGPVSNSGITTVRGDVGTNVGLTTGFDSLLVNGTIHPIPDLSTAQCASDLGVAYNYLNLLTHEIELLYPAQFGRNLVLTPHTYLLDAATIFTDSLYLNAQGDPNAVFVIKINGALSTSTYARVLLINQAQAQNVYWKVEGAVEINDNSIFCGTVVCNNGALNILNPGVELHGRALNTTGAVTTVNVDVINSIIPSTCFALGLPSNGALLNDAISIYPNPFGVSKSLTVKKPDESGDVEIKLFNAYGGAVLSRTITQSVTTLETGLLASGIYYYQVVANGIRIQSGKLIAE